MDTNGKEKEIQNDPSAIEIGRLKTEEILSKNKFNFSKIQDRRYQYAKKVASFELSIIEASHELKIPLLDFFTYLIEIKDEELKELLEPILFPLGIDDSKQARISLQAYPKNVQKEFLLLSLTYRVSFKSLARIIGSTVEDILYTFLSFEEYFDSVNYLFFETMNEDEFSEKLAFTNAKKYYLKRNKLIKALKEAMGGKEELKQQIQKLHQEINDSLLTSIVQKDGKNLTQNERDFLAMYPIKYGLALMECERKLFISRKTFHKYQNDLAERKPIFADKLNIYQAKSDFLSNKYVEDRVKNYRGGGSR